MPRSILTIFRRLYDAGSELASSVAARLPDEDPKYFWIVLSAMLAESGTPRIAQRSATGSFIQKASPPPLLIAWLRLTAACPPRSDARSEEHTSELQSLRH